MARKLRPDERMLTEGELAGIDKAAFGYHPDRVWVDRVAILKAPSAMSKLYPRSFQMGLLFLCAYDINFDTFVATGYLPPKGYDR